ncbi:hypothetical protein ASD60_00285 [Pseudomonas sp. Root562]|nr:hypothetical protein ASD60_00285 [Pseudomonas sp. Root562]
MGELLNGSLVVSRQQSTRNVIMIATLLRQQLRFCLKHTLAGAALQFRHQMLVTIKSLHFFLPQWLQPDQQIQCVVTIAAQICGHRQHLRSMIVA